MHRHFETLAQRNAKAIRQLVDPSDEDSPIHRLKGEIVEVLGAQMKAVHEKVEQLTTHLKVEEGKAEVFNITTQKGFVFEEQVFEAVSQLSAPYGDLVEATGDVPGGDGKAGDVVVTINPDDARGARYVVEAKDRKLGRMPAGDEIKRAMKNRQAQIGILVFSDQENAPGSVPFSYHGDYAFVVFDKDTQDLGALRLACMWARWVARRQATSDSDGVDVDRISALIGQAERSLNRVTTIRRAHTSAKNQIGAADAELGVLAQELHGMLDELSEQIAAVEEPSDEPSS